MDDLWRNGYNSKDFYHTSNTLKRVVDRFKELVEENNLGEKIELAGRFCMGKCGEGVCVTIDETTHSIKPEDTDAFFKAEVLAKL